MGTQLMARGLPPGECGELWNLAQPDVVEQIQREYVEAGADLLLTNTFGANPVVLGRHGLADRTEETNLAGVEIARRAAGDSALVVGDMASTGGLLEPLGDLTEREVYDAFGRQTAALATGGVDAIICETFESRVELRLALEAARDHSDVPLIASMTFRPEASGRYRSMMGEGPEDVVRIAAECQCAVVGTNCGQGIQTMAPLVAELCSLADEAMPVIVQPNAGLPRLADGRTVYQEDPEVFRRHVPDLYSAGARIIGGCDGTTPEHVRVIREFADSL